ncbi:hypothetical protein [Dickeya zeae]|uniref:hypothetical protein n=1 Tax=Dickeya zeae TaxID=204042 RepID=UPI00205F383B|nr:hypothetical protein [Dickeya zeae]UPT54796.1 hypothetical protein FGI00_04070 [Dickeya zeae]
MAREDKYIIFYALKLFIGLLLFFGSAFFGIFAPMAYAGFITILFPVAISLRLHHLKEKGICFLPKKEENWVVYIQGIPVYEKRTPLINPCFFDKTTLSLFFLRAFSLKLAYQLVILYFFIKQTLAVQAVWLYISPVLIMPWLLFSTYKTFRDIQDIRQQQWAIEEYVSPSRSLWYQGFLMTPKMAIDALNKLLSF